MTFMPDPTYGELSAQLRHARRRLVQLATAVGRTVATMPIVAQTTIDLKNALTDCMHDMQPNAEEMAIGQAIDVRRTAYRRTAVERECGEAPEGLGGLRCTRPHDHAGPHVHVPMRAETPPSGAALEPLYGAADFRAAERRAVAEDLKATFPAWTLSASEFVSGDLLAAAERRTAAAEERSAILAGLGARVAGHVINWTADQARAAEDAADKLFRAIRRDDSRDVPTNLDRVMRIVNALQQPRVVSVDVDRQFVYFDRDEKTGRWRVTYTKSLLNEG